MELQLIDMGERVFVLINTPRFFFNIAMNILFACCLMSPFGSRQKLKLPVKILLGIIVCCSIFYFLSLVSFYFVFRDQSNLQMTVVMLITAEFYAHNSMACYVWLNLYYYTQIVPAHRALLIWVKKNIKSVIYALLIFDGSSFLLNCSVSVADVLKSRWIHINGTFTRLSIKELSYFSNVCFTITEVQIFICCFVMMTCSFSTAHYLHKHVKSMAKSGSIFTTPRLQSQIRVAVTGIMEGVLCLTYLIFNLYESAFTILFSHFCCTSFVSFTVASLYTTGTTINLSIGQSMFRQRAARVWKTLKAQLGIGTVIHDMKRHPAQMTE